MKIRYLKLSIICCWLVLLSCFTASQVQGQSVLDVCDCDGASGTLIAVSEPGTFNDTTKTQLYILVGAAGEILQTSSTGSFPNVGTGVYEIYALNYDPTEITTGLAVGDTLLNTLTVGNSTDPCYDLLGPAMEVLINVGQVKPI